jgi:molybdopterin adenylyltransferase
MSLAAPDAMRVAVLTVSDRAAAGTYDDLAGPALVDLLRNALSARIIETAIVPDERGAIVDRLTAWADEAELDLILTTGGTGFAPRDVTPEATTAVIQRPAPGLAEAVRAAALQTTSYAMLSRATAGIRDRTLIINLPGSPKGALDGLRVLLPVLAHAIAQLRGEPSDLTHHGFGLGLREV